MDYSPRYRLFRALLRQIREEARLTQATLAVRLRKPQTFVSKCELGERRIDLLEVVDFCAACGVTGPEFLVRRLEELRAGSDVPERVRRQSPRRMDRQGG